MHMMSKYMNMQFSANTLRRIRPILYSRKENSVHIKYALWHTEQRRLTVNSISFMMIDLDMVPFDL